MTNDQRSDAILIEALNSVLEGARSCFDHYKNQARLGVWLPRPSPDIEGLLVPVRTALTTHPKFKEDGNRFFGSKQLMRHPYYQAHNILRVAVDRDPLAAVAWYHKVHSTERADLRYVAEVYGLKISETITLTNGVTLLALANLPPSENARAIQSRFEIYPNRLPVTLATIPIGATLEIQGVPGGSDYAMNSQIVPPRSDELERTIRADPESLNLR